MSEQFIVTGGAGFIGSRLVKALNERGFTNILVVDHLDSPVKKQNLDRIKFSEYFDKSEFRIRIQKEQINPVKAVFHLGACSSTTETNETYLMDNNCFYTSELCEWSLRNQVRFIYASSAATYGNGEKGYCDEEELISTLKPLNHYGKSKHTFDLWALETGVIRLIAGLKYFNVYGPWEDHKNDMRSVVNKSFDQVLKDGKITLFKSHRSGFRDGEQKRDFIYVDDAVDVTLFFYDNPAVSGLFNCGTGLARTWIDLANAVFKAMHRPSHINFIDMPESVRDQYQYFTQADITKLRYAGYSKPFLSIEEGIQKYVNEGYPSKR